MIDFILRIKEKETTDEKNPSPIKILIRKLKPGMLDGIIGVSNETSTEPKSPTDAEIVAGALLLGYVADIGTQLQMFSGMASGKVAPKIITPKGAGGLVVPGGK